MSTSSSGDEFVRSVMQRIFNWYSSKEWQQPRVDRMKSILGEMAKEAKNSGIINIVIETGAETVNVIEAFNFVADTTVMSNFKNNLDLYEHLSLYFRYMVDYRDDKSGFPYPLYVTMKAYWEVVSFLMQSKAQVLGNKADELPCQNQIYITTLDKDFPGTKLTKGKTNPETGSFNYDAYKGMVEAFNYLNKCGLEDATLADLIIEHLRASRENSDVSNIFMPKLSKTILAVTKRTLSMATWVPYIAEIGPPPEEHIYKFEELTGKSDTTLIKNRLSPKECGGSNPGSHMLFTAFLCQTAKGMNTFGPVLDGKKAKRLCPGCHKPLECRHCGLRMTGSPEYIPAAVKKGLLGYRIVMIYDPPSLARDMCAFALLVDDVSIFY